MCLTIVEILMLITGFWALISGKLPSGLFKILFGKGDYNTEPGKARLIGLLLASPIPLTFLSGIALGALIGAEKGVQYAIVLETLIVIVVCILAVIIARRIKNADHSIEI